MNREVGCYGSVLGLVLLSACVAETADSDPSEMQGVLARIQALGFDATTAIFEDNRIAVEGDILLYRDALLAGEYESLPEAGADTLVHKGYRHVNKVNTTNDGKIKLMATAAVLANPGLVTGAVVSADSWSANSSIDIRGSNTGPGITIKFQDPTPCPGSEGSNIPACAEFPISGKPGHSIYLRNSPAAGCSWNQQLATFILGHEMGHTIGMVHPRTGSHIAGTGSCDAWLQLGWPAETCTSLGLAPYDTVMNPSAWGISGCGVADPYLGDDDFASVTALYPP